MLVRLISPSGEKVICLLIFLTFRCLGRLEKKNDKSDFRTMRMYHLSKNGGRFESFVFPLRYSKSKAVNPNSLITVPITSDGDVIFITQIPEIWCGPACSNRLYCLISAVSAAIVSTTTESVSTISS